MNKEIIKTEFVIIGAGYAGIAAAGKLHEAGKDFRILEARDRIGGRVHTQTLLDSDVTVDVGGQWIGPDQQLMWEWVKKHNVETYDCYDSGLNIYHYKGRTRKYTGTIPKMNPVALLDMGIAMARLNRKARKVNTAEPWLVDHAINWDGLTMNTWIRKNTITKEARKALHIGLETIFACEASEISLLQFLFYCKSGKNLDTLLAVTGGAQQTLFRQGAQHLLELEAASIREHILLNQVVHSISQSKTDVCVTTDILEVHARRVIVTIPPALCQKIHFAESLPAKKAQLFQRIPMGAAMKCIVVYDRPFWREQGFSGQIVSDRSPFNVSFDLSKPEGEGIFLFFVEGRNAREFIELPQITRRKMVLEELVGYFGEKAWHPIDYIDKCWTDEEFSGGCYVGNFTPGSWTQFGEVLRKPIGRIHWAGTETAEKWCGYMDGAIQSGYRAAGEVMEAELVEVKGLNL